VGKVIHAVLVSPYCWWSEEGNLLLLPYPPALRGKGVGLVIRLTDPPRVQRVISPHADEMDRYMRTGRWSREAKFEEVSFESTDFEDLLTFHRDLRAAQRELNHPSLAPILAELAARALKIS
jgi:hypothetical protein